ISISNGSLSSATASTINSNLTLSSGTLSGDGNLTGTGVLTWTGGTMAGSGQTVVGTGGTLTLGDLSGSQLYLSRVLRNDGAATWTDYTYIPLSGGTFVNNGSLTADALSNGLRAFSDGGTNAFINNGTFVKQGPAPARIQADVPFTNAGTVDIQTGTLDL